MAVLKSSAWLLWAVLGLFGGHLFYLGRRRQGLMALCSLNFLFLGCVRDALRMDEYLKEVALGAGQGSTPLGADPSQAEQTIEVADAAAAPEPAEPPDPAPVALGTLVQANMQAAPYSSAPASVPAQASMHSRGVSLASVDSGLSADRVVLEEEGTPTHTNALEWAQRRKAEETQAERMRQEELLGSMTEEQRAEHVREEKVEAERRERQGRLLKKQLLGYSSMTARSPTGRARGKSVTTGTSASPSSATSPPPTSSPGAASPKTTAATTPFASAD